ncbi:PREDICTED: eukaryotic translation initiation factor 3 subunit A isoform X2 [Gekko japonicus]|uniref:Eukaryotic translation initiation factor 3 subunit A n=1 Tax=Gekko japonicus TaxID=146911 RepID=A0ABM1JLQ7_GEKJA|nr:PREDICTED: eukaryotic translation initiation factor 3 subunit A isoform X2 [Gekko japonicus]
MPVYFQRPENALKRANEFLEVGKKQPALDVLYDVMKSKKHRTWQKIHEPIMLKYLELCVDLRKSHLAKEGLYQYKNICQQVNIKSLEDVVRAYLKLAEEKTEAAKEESQQMVLDIEDLDNIQTPESVLLSAVSGEDTQDRTDRLLLTPWVKFLWESYRQCLDLLRNNSRVERLYHDIAQQAFKFCLQYTRKAEFRKLCDNLRMHLGQIQRHHNQSTAINLNNPESQSMHLETRLVQLDSAISMELWQEAFKAVEDIHGLFSLSKKPPKPQLMANYYHKVSTVFWKSGNALFHASTLHRLYHLSREMRKNLTQDEMQRMSTRVLLATLSIPITPERTDIARLLDMDGIIVEKQRRLATLLGLQAPPTRISLINDMVRFNVVQYVVPEVKELYNWLEVDFHPLKLCGRVCKVLNWVRDQSEKESELQLYIPHLQNNTILRLLQQVAQIYQSIEFSRLTTLVPFVDAFQLERAIVDAARHCDLQVRIDHTTRTLSFGSDLNYCTREDAPLGPQLQSMPSEQIRNQLTAMSSALAKALEVIKPPHLLLEKEEQHQQAVTAYLKNSKKEHQRILARRQTIEERKERLENLNIQREKEEMEQREAELQKVRKAEEERLRQEAKEREKERILQEHEQIKKKTVRERLEQIKKTELGAKAFKDIDIEDLEELDPDFIMAKQVEQLEKEKKELQERLKNQEKKIDYFERAKRLEEIPLIKSAYEEQRVRDMELWEQQEEERITTMQLEREKALEHKGRLSRMLEERDLFEARLKAARKSVYEEKLKQFQERLAEERHNRLAERKRQRKEERRITYYQEKEEEEQRLKEEKMLKEQEEKERVEREKREQEMLEYQERVRKLEEVERKKRQRELEIEERERRREEERRNLEDPLSRKESRWGDRESESTWRRSTEPESEWRRPAPEREWRRGEARDEEKPFRKDEATLRGTPEERASSPTEAPEEKVLKHDPDEEKGPKRALDDDKPSWRSMGDDRGPRRGLDDDRGPRRGLDDDRGPRRGLDDDRASWRSADDEKGPRRGMDDDWAPRRGLDDDRAPRRGMDDDWGPRRGLDDDRGPRRGLDDDRPSWRNTDEDRAPRRGLDEDRGPRRGLDEDRISRRDEDRGPWRNVDEDRISRRDDDRGPRRAGDDDRGPRRADDSRRGDDSRSGPWRPFGKPGGWREREKAREDSWGPPRDSRPSEDREWDRDKDNDENEKDRELDKDRDFDREDRFKRPRDDPGWRRAPAEETSSWRESGRRDEWDRPGRDSRDDRSSRDLRDRRGEERERRGPPPPRTDREEMSSWRRGDDRREEREERETVRRLPGPATPPVSKERDKDGEKEKGAWRTEKERESLRRTKNETDEDGWTTVRR